MIGIVMLNYNGWKMSFECVKSIRENTYIDYKIYLVDNASSENMPEYFESFIKQSSDIIYIHNFQNQGYSAGNNLGIEKAISDNCDEVLITNNDVIFTKGCIDELKNALNRDERIGIVGPKVFLKSKRLQEINMGCKMDMKGKYKYILRKSPFSFLSKEFVRKFHAEDNDKNMPFEVFAVSGCCFMMSKKCSRIIYPLDENTFLYEEENILGCHMEKANLKTVYYSPCTIIHLGGESTKSMASFAYKSFVSSEIYYCRKYLKANRLVLFPLYILRSFKYIKDYKNNGLKSYIVDTWNIFSK